MREVKGYLASQLGFSETGEYVLRNLVRPRIEQIGIVLHDPFLECAKELDAEYLARLEGYRDRMRYWEDFSRKVTPINHGLMQDSDCLLAILDGGHTVDDGVSSEIGYYAGIRRGPIFALRSDLRCGENMAVSINPQILGCILHSGGDLVDGKDAVNRWFASIEEWYGSVVGRC